MRSHLTVGAMLASVATVAANAGCAADSLNNWYCSAVDSIAYTNFGSSGTYQEVTSINGGSCTQGEKAYGGPLAPLNGEVSWHFRGPLVLKQFAVYTLGSEEKKRNIKPSLHERRHGHAHLHKRKEKRAVGDIVTATIDGQVVTWVNEWAGGAAPTPAAEVEDGGKSGNSKAYKAASSAPASDDRKPAAPINAGKGKWGRQAYYNAQAGTADGLTFLNHFGGDKSGVFDYDLGNSLSYASKDALSGCASPEVLEDKMIPDNVEVILMSDKKCNGDCGAVRPGTVAYHGFEGESKLFLLELSMPLTGKKGWNEDMPAAWILNAAIPRTLQYGKPECSCWKTGCGEFDVLEILDSGNTRAKSTLHGNISGGDSYYFNRPTDGLIKVAVVFNALTSSAHIKILDDDVEFGPTVDATNVSKFCEKSAKNSIFTLGS
ncbi:hypothetical protein AJ80_04475 [Polytolypa hystricis UAMH7299]|uniref:glucan endo-1,3-beta-D-glucosidase n=1 Tax=Polytolypa hystricis (strain UAMH7299) TaxID=1447883 RepID=A0A2B7YB67_POLH7|nr:hypothetical protein AJ80_04475 [Polytolypa hystricis UAMH7299]